MRKLAIAMLLFSVSCVTYREAWRRDQLCFSRCQTDLGLQWQGGRYADDSAYCICVADFQGDLVWGLTPMTLWPGGIPREAPVYKIPRAFRQCRDRSSIVCGEF